MRDSRPGAGRSEESARVAAAFLRENLPDLAVTPPQVMSGEVVVDA